MAQHGTAQHSVAVWHGAAWQQHAMRVQLVPQGSTAAMHSCCCFAAYALPPRSHTHHSHHPYAAKPNAAAITHFNIRGTRPGTPPPLLLDRCSELTRTWWFNPASLESEVEYALVGAVLGLAIYNGVVGDASQHSAAYASQHSSPA